MRFLLDTHLAFWWQTADRRLSTATRELIDGGDAPPLISRVSLWELAIKASAGKLRINLAEFVSRTEATGFEWLAIENAHILEVTRLPVFPDHKDPFDRLLIAQSASEPLILLTADAKLARYGGLVRVV